MRYLVLLLLINVIFSQDIKRTSDFKRSTAYGIDCDDTEYRDYKGSPAWKGYGGWLSECDSISTVRLNAEFALKSKERRRLKAIQDSIDIATASFDDIDLDVMWENTVWEEIDEITEVYGEVEQITAVAGVRGAEAEDEALNHLYYRRSMKGLALIDLQKAYGKLINTRAKVTDPQNIIKIDNLLSQLKKRIQNAS
jgi:hypothetical protein